MKSERKKSTTGDRRTEYDAWYEEQVRLGLKDIEEGRVASDEDLRRHFEKRFKKHAGRQKQAA